MTSHVELPQFNGNCEKYHSLNFHWRCICLRKPLSKSAYVLLEQAHELSTYRTALLQIDTPGPVRAQPPAPGA